MQVNIWLEHKIQVGYSENADSELHCFISSPVGRRVGQEKSTAGFQNKVDAKKPDSRKNPLTEIPTQSPTKWVCVGEEKQGSGRMAILA